MITAWVKPWVFQTVVYLCHLLHISRWMNHLSLCFNISASDYHSSHLLKGTYFFNCRNLKCLHQWWFEWPVRAIKLAHIMFHQLRLHKCIFLPWISSLICWQLCWIGCLSYMKFTHVNQNSRIAGETVHFWDEVRELSKLSLTQQDRRVYMADHIIQKYIVNGMVSLTLDPFCYLDVVDPFFMPVFCVSYIKVSKKYESIVFVTFSLRVWSCRCNVGSQCEINISAQMRLEILSTNDLADPNLFKRAAEEAVHMMQTVGNFHFGKM